MTSTLLDLLNIVDSGFPTGAYGHSAGLEYAVQKGLVTSPQDLADWARGALLGSFLTLDLRASVRAWFGTESLEELNEELAAFRTSKVQREASAQVGRSFFRTVRGVYPHLDFGREGEAIEASPQPDSVQFPLAWGLVCRKLGIETLPMAEALVFSALRQVTMVAIRIIPLGQRDAFSVQTALLGELSLPRDWETEAASPLQSFAPGLELAGLGQENLERKYFRS